MIDIFWTSIGSIAALLTMLVQTSIGASFWILYGIHISDPIVVIANVVSLTTLIIAIFLYINYISNIERHDIIHDK